MQPTAAAPRRRPGLAWAPLPAAGRQLALIHGVPPLGPGPGPSPRPGRGVAGNFKLKLPGPRQILKAHHSPSPPAGPCGPGLAGRGTRTVTRRRHWQMQPTAV